MKNMCYTCHGTAGQGGGPRLRAAHRLTTYWPLEGFAQQVRRPREQMPRYPKRARERPGPRGHLRLRLASIEARDRRRARFRSSRSDDHEEQLIAVLPPRWQRRGRLQTGAGRRRDSEARRGAVRGCHELVARHGRSGYSAHRLAHSVLGRMMRNVGAHVHAMRRWQPHSRRLPRCEHYPGETAPRRGDGSGAGARRDRRMDSVPSPGARPHDPLMSRDGAALVHGPVQQHAGAARPAHRRVPRIRAEDSEVGTAHGLIEDSPRAHLVHREFRRRTSAPSIRRPAA